MKILKDDGDPTLLGFFLVTILLQVIIHGVCFGCAYYPWLFYHLNRYFEVPK